MGKVLIIKDADFSKVAVTNIEPGPTPGTLKYETVPDLNKSWDLAGGSERQYCVYAQVTVDGISCYHPQIAGIEGKFTDGVNLQLVKINALTKEYSTLKNFVVNGSGVQTLLLDSIVNFEANEYIGIGLPAEQTNKGIYYDRKPGNCTTADVPYSPNLNNRYAYRRIYVE